MSDFLNNRAAAVLCLLLACTLRAETGSDAWLRYAPLEGATLTRARNEIPAVVVNLDDSAVAGSGQNELIRGLRGMIGRTLRAETSIPREGAIVIGTLDELRKARPQMNLSADFAPESYWLKRVESDGATYTLVTARDSIGLLYGASALLRKIALGDSLAAMDEKSSPYAPIRWVNQWDNLDGSIERGYGGRSIFWDKMKVRDDLSRVSAYGRLLSSLGINACSINNVNANPRILAPEMIPQIARIAEAFRPWGVRVAIAVDFGSPKTIGGLDTFDPVDERVAAWWKSTFDALYAAVPDLAGVVLKADSEGRVGPSTYGRTHADAANVVARALQPHGGILLYRGFVYDHHMDWNNLKNDRGRAAWDNFQPLDGKFDDNVIIQIKHGPIDFQVREPASPLFGALEHTNQAIELQITQEYFGQAKQMNFLVPMWKTALDFDMHASGAAATPVKALAAGKTFHRPLGGFVGVANIGLDENWSGNQISQANLYGYARLAWNPDLSSRQIAGEWTRLTFGLNPKVDDTIGSMLLSSWRTYENYTGPLGLQTLTDMVGNHYGVNVDASERNGWGQWHRADEKGVGMDRTTATGTGYIGQYRPAVARVYESLETCPDDLLLFLHHVPYTYRLHSGKTVIQYIYDSHYEGAAAVEQYVEQWKMLRGLVDEERFRQVMAMLQYQAGQAEVWRDAVNTWFHRASHIDDAAGRVGHYPGRTEVEAMSLDGYTVRDVTPYEDASGGQAVGCPAHNGSCSASMKFAGTAGWYNLRVQYFDQSNGASHYRVFLGKQLIDEWDANLQLPRAIRLDSTSSTRRLIPAVALRPGDEIRIEGHPDGGEVAGLDYVEIVKETAAPPANR